MNSNNIIKLIEKKTRKDCLILLPLAHKTNPAIPRAKPTVISANENNVSNCVCVNFDLTYSINENN